MAQDFERTHGFRRAGEVARLDVRIAARRKTGWRENAWLVPVVAVLFTLMIMTVPTFLTLDPAKQSAPINPSVAGLDNSLIVAHVLLSTVALVTVCVGVWPWLRRRYPAVHRWSGRVYVFAALPASLLTLVITYFNTIWGADVGAYATGGAWFTTTLIGYVAIRKGNQARHRRWMVYSFAMATSVVWSWILTPIFMTETTFPYVMELVRWGGWLVNLGAAKWYLDRTARRSAAVVRFPAERRRDQIRAADRRSDLLRRRVA